MAVTLQRPIARPRRRRLYTSSDLLRMPHDSRFELVRGELVPMSPPPGGEHGNLTISLSSRATIYVMDRGLGYCFAAETGFKIHGDPDSVRAPDWAFIRKERLTEPITVEHVGIVPDVVLEVRSPSDRRREFASRIEMWISAGVQIVWALDATDRTLTVHRPHSVRVLGEADTLTGDELIPGFELRLAQVFGEAK